MIDTHIYIYTNQWIPSYILVHMNRIPQSIDYMIDTNGLGNPGLNHVLTLQSERLAEDCGSL